MKKDIKNPVKVVTCEGDVVTVKVPPGVYQVEIPLKKIKTYRWSETLKREIPVHFREIFKFVERYYVDSKEAYDQEVYLTFKYWVSERIE